MTVKHLHNAGALCSAVVVKRAAAERGHTYDLYKIIAKYIITWQKLHNLSPPRKVLGKPLNILCYTD